MTTPAPPTSAVHLTAAGVSLILDAPERNLPRVAYWGAALGDIDVAALTSIGVLNTPSFSGGTVDGPAHVSLLTEPSTGWPGSAGLLGSRDGRAWTTAFQVTDHNLTHDAATGTQRSTWHAEDTDAALTLTLVVELTAAGVVQVSATLTNVGEETYQLDHLGLALPVPRSATEILDFTGRWARERAPQRRPFLVGSHVREAVRGKPGHDSSYLTIAGPSGFGFRHGDVRAVHVAWSGNQRVTAEKTYTGEQVIRGGEYFHPGEQRLQPGASYTTPTVLGVWSGQGLDGVSARFHEQMRTRDRYPTTPRPVTINVWEAVYFDHRLDRLVDLADRAADLGVERYVLDDGWFGSRRDDTSGLGDWQISPDVWPGDTLRQLADHVHSRGMEFGIWFEPEMINPDSELARNHPEWVLKPQGRMPREARQQQVLNLAHPDAYAYVLDAMSTVIADLNVDYIKWDHNRDLLESGSQQTGTAFVHEQTLAAYRLLDDLRARFATLEIESCSGGGARMDWGILQRTDRVWASDCIDAHERQAIQRWTTLMVPPELMGSHVGDGRAHTTGRMHDLDYRAGTALFGHFGIEWDLAKAADDDVERLRGWIDRYKQMRPLLHGGTVVRADTGDAAGSDGDAILVHGVVSPQQDDALFAIVATDRPDSWPIGRLTLPGLDPQVTYRVSVEFAPDAMAEVRRQPGWWKQPVEVSGAVLGQVGLYAPELNPDTLALVRVTKVS